MKRLFIITAVSAMMIFTGCSQSSQTTAPEVETAQEANQDSEQGENPEGNPSMALMKMGKVTEIDGTSVTIKTADMPEGENPNGEKPDGEKPDGEKPDGEKPDGEMPDGEKPDGEKPDGEKPDGEKPDGEKPDGEKPDGEMPTPKDMSFEGEEVSVADVTGILKKNTSADAGQNFEQQLEDADVSELSADDIVQIIYGDNDEIKYVVIMPKE